MKSVFIANVGVAFFRAANSLGAFLAAPAKKVQGTPSGSLWRLFTPVPYTFTAL